MGATIDCAKMNDMLQEQLNTWDNTVKGLVTEPKVSVSPEGDVDGSVETLIRR